MAKRATTKSTAKTEEEPEKINPILPLQFIKGIGPARAAALAELGVLTVRDLLLFAPRGYLDRRTVLPLRQIRILLTGEEGVPDQVTAIVAGSLGFTP